MAKEEKTTKASQENVENKETTSQSNWFKQGKDVFTVKKQLDSLAKSRKERAVQRFFLKAGDEAVICFVDSSPFGLYEHNLRIDGKWGNHYTCMKDTQPCPICQHFPDNRPTWTAYFTIIDTRAFTRKSDGQEVKNRKILYPAKGNAIARLEKLLEKNKSLAGLAFKVSRISDTEPNCGSDFELIGKVNMQKKFGDDSLKPIDYMKVLAYPSDEELSAIGIGDFVPIETETNTTTPEITLEDLL